MQLVPGGEFTVRYMLDKQNVVGFNNSSPSVAQGTQYDESGNSSGCYVLYCANDITCYMLYAVVCRHGTPLWAVPYNGSWTTGLGSCHEGYYYGTYYDAVKGRLSLRKRYYDQIDNFTMNEPAEFIMNHLSGYPILTIDGLYSGTNTTYYYETDSDKITSTAESTFSSTWSGTTYLTGYATSYLKDITNSEMNRHGVDLMYECAVYKGYADPAYPVYYD